MFVLSSTYESLKRQHDSAVRSYNRLLREWNQMVELINKKGGQDFLNDGVVLSQNDIKDLLTLCHPDKHQNSDTSVRVTKFLLGMRR